MGNRGELIGLCVCPLDIKEPIRRDFNAVIFFTIELVFGQHGAGWTHPSGQNRQKYLFEVVSAAPGSRSLVRASRLRPLVDPEAWSLEPRENAH